VGLIAGSYLYAELSETLDRTVKKWGDRDKVLLPDLLGAPRGVVVVGTVVVLTTFLIFVERTFPR